MERTIQRTEILLPSNLRSRQAASAIHYTNGNFRIEWFASIGAALENLLAQVGSIAVAERDGYGEIQCRRLPRAQV